MSSRLKQLDPSSVYDKIEPDEETTMFEENEYDSAEDTEEASENELGSSMNHHTIDERMEIKEQMYQDKLANLMHQLDLLKQRQHPDYLRAVEKLEAERDDRLLLNELHREYMLQCCDRDCILEVAAAEREYEEKKAELKENLISDLEDRKKLIEHEFATMELSGDSIDVKPTVTRKLRRRPNEPLPVPEKRRKPTTSQLVFLLDEKEIEHDLKLVSRGKALYSGRSQQHQIMNSSGTSGNASSNAGSSGNSSSCVSQSIFVNSSGVGYSGNQSADQNGEACSDAYGSSATAQTEQSSNMQQCNFQQQPSSAQQQQNSLSETRIEDGKLWYERRWFHRGQPVYVEGKDFPRFAANISAIGVEGICVKKASDCQKVRIFLSHLRRGKVSIKRRAS